MHGWLIRGVTESVKEKLGLSASGLYARGGGGGSQAKKYGI